MQYTINNASDFRMFNQNKPMIKCGVSEKRLMELNKRAFKEFYFRPSYIFRIALNVIRNPVIGLRGLKTVLGWIK